MKSFCVCRGVGLAYDLDQGSVADRKSELSKVFADYDAVYNGEECLNNIQITALLTISVKRALDEAAECVKALDNFSCDIQVSQIAASGLLPLLVFLLCTDRYCTCSKGLRRTEMLDQTYADG
jgi:hypothetical protein